MGSLFKKSFNSQKCKTLLQVSSQKMKVLRNKHTLSIKSSRAKVAELLSKGQCDNAKTQVENIFREEKIVALYNLLEHFCHLLVDSIENIKSQRDCPANLKEAVASLIYAAHKCGEIEELNKLSSYLTRKYGTEFAITVKDLRQNCGVNVLVIQNLSSTPLSSDARLKLLKDIALEHRINWDYNAAVAESVKEHGDVSDGPRHFSTGTEALIANIHNMQRSTSMSISADDANKLAKSTTNNAFRSDTSSPRSSLGSPFESAYEQENLNADINGKSASMRTQNALGVKNACTVDPYTLAKLEGKMDYQSVLDYMDGYESTNLDSEQPIHFDPIIQSTPTVNPYAWAKSRGRMDYKNLIKYMSGGNECLDDEVLGPNRVLQPGYKSVLSCDQRDLNKEEIRDEEEQCVLNLEAAARLAFASASEAAEAAKAAVALVCKKSNSFNKSSRSANIKQPLRSMSASGESSSNPTSSGSNFAGDERTFSLTSGRSYACTDFNSDVSEDMYEHLARATPISRSDVQSSSPRKDNSHVNKIGSDNLSQDITENVLKHTVSKQDSHSRTSDSLVSMKAHSRGSNSSESISDHPVNEFFEEVKDRVVERGKDSVLDIDDKRHTDTQDVLPIPQFDDYSSDEILEESITIHTANEVALKENFELFSRGSRDEQDNIRQTKDFAPQFDDEGIYEHSDEDVPFYLKGRPAMMKEYYDDDDDVYDRKDRDKLKKTRALDHDSAEVGSSLNVQSFEIENQSLDIHYDEYLANDLCHRQEVAPEWTSLSSQEHIDSESSSTQSSFKSQLDLSSGGKGQRSAVNDSNSTVIMGHHQKMKQLQSSFTDCSLNAGLDENLSTDTAIRKPSFCASLTDDDVRRNHSSQARSSPQWCSISEDSECTVKKGSRTRPSEPEFSHGLDNELRISETDVELPKGVSSTMPRKYQGLSRRSVRSTRSR
ncbi:hypothetical protein KP509_15G039800 [Ceratopteris richardii]|uniref:IST1-like protein n=1 Tax=Ceratopteris richardii TaxID=49495 RepID=A0A8T2T3L8_CERRI|nr:hypothetical protein KP509_15G039800 [Ceratopteris richardii]KAH7404715.1 hypothetical protein KP509_15G039800 [Ceratopteris richardii]